MEHWTCVLSNGYRIGEVNFCPLCSSEVKTTLEIPETDGTEKDFPTPAS